MTRNSPPPRGAADFRLNRRELLATVGALGVASCNRSPESAPSPGPRRRVADVLSPLALNRVRIGGYLGHKIDLAIRNRIFAQNSDALVEPFRHRNEKSCWQTEFWGKWMLSAAPASQYTGQQHDRVRDSVHQLLATQTSDGYIGDYAPSKHLDAWDVWGRKYTLLGLLASGDAAALDGARRLADHLLSEMQNVDIAKTGLYRGMASSSVLDPMVQLYRHTADERYLRFAEHIVSQWSSSAGPQLIEKAQVPVGQRFLRPKKWFSWDNGEKAYEMMSCYAGLLELYRETGVDAYLNAARSAAASIRDTELNAAGSGSAEECWYGGAALQTQPAHNPMETCVAVSWMHLCAHLLRLTADPAFADQIEQTAYNALLGALTPDASSFAKYSALEGTRALGESQCGMDLNCCVANGPRGLMLLPSIAVMTGPRGPVVNLYSAGHWSTDACEIEVKTAYPFEPAIDISITPKQSGPFSLDLRIPAWSDQSSLTVNGAPVKNVQPGAYASIDRRWKPGDRVRLEFDFRGRVLRSGSFSALARGPLLLARDLRLGQQNIDAPAAAQLPLRSIPAPPGIAAAFQTASDVRLCEYASAGNTWDASSRYRVWMPAA
jgi:uncharacterized protein